MEEVPRIVNPSVTKKILKEHDVRLTKKLGQHFLIDGNTLRKEINMADLDRNDLVIEIGPGIGTLTQALAEKAGRVVAIEYDKRFVKILAETLALYNNVEIIEGDALVVDLDPYISDSSSVKLVANLPYNIATPVIGRFLEEFPEVSTMVVMVQREVADRIVASPGSKDYGFYTVKIQFYADSRKSAIVPRTVFMPSPRIDSAIIEINRRRKPVEPVSDPDAFFSLVKILFNERRKTIGTILLTHISELSDPKSRDIFLNRLAESGISYSSRPECLSIGQFAEIFRLVQQK